MPDRFREIVRRIMAGADVTSTETGTRPNKPESFGWLRRPELDQPDGEAWELPSGAIRITGRGPATPDSGARARRSP